MSSLAKLLTLALVAGSFAPVRAAEPQTITAAEIAARLSAVQQDGQTYVRLRMEVGAARKEALQIQIKQRRTKGGTEVIYQLLFPKERKGEAVLLRKVGSRAASGTRYSPSEGSKPIGSMKEPLFDSELSYEDIVENFFSWGQQALVGTETVDGVNCQILESKPGKGDRSSYGSVRSWIDTRRMVPMRVEKYSGSGQLIRRINTTRVVADAGRHIPANLSVRGLRDVTTEIDGSKIRHDVNFAEDEFTEEGLKNLNVPKGQD